MSTILSIDGVAIDRAVAGVTLARLTPYRKDGVPSLTFARRGITLAAPPDPYSAKPCTLTQDGVLLFSGEVGTHFDHYDPALGWVREYTAQGLRAQADGVPVTDSQTSTDTIQYNLEHDSPDYLPSRAGRTVGQIVADVLEMPANSAGLQAVGIGRYTSPSGTGAQATAILSHGVVTGYTIVSGGSGYTTAPTVIVSGGSPAVQAHLTANVSGGAVTSLSIVSGGSGYRELPVFVLSRLPTVTLGDLDTLGIVPPFRVTVAGERILGALEGLVQSCHPNHTLHVTPDGTIRFLDLRTFPNTTLTLGTDPRVGMPQLSRDSSGCYSRALVRGATRTLPVTVATKPAPGSGAANNGLVEDFGHDGLSSAQAKAAWVPTDYSTPGVGNGQDYGTCSCPNTATVRVHSSFPSYQWPADFWDQTDSGHKGTIVLSSDVIPGYTQKWTARVIGNTALSPGGTSDLTIDNPLPALTYTSYQLYGMGGAGVVWRRYKLTNAALGAALQNYFPLAVAFRNSDGTAATLTTTPTGTIVSTQGVAVPMGLSVDPTSGTITFNKPTGLVFSSNGTTVVAPADVQAFLAVAGGLLQAVWPADSGGVPQFSGTSYSLEAISKTKVVSVNDWRDYGNASNMLLFARELHDALSDTVIEGDLTYHGLLSSVLDFGHALSIAADSYTTGWEAAAVPIVAVDLSYNEGPGGTSYETMLHVSNRRAPYSGSVFTRPSQTGQAYGMPGPVFSPFGGPVPKAMGGGES
jgi:hypothetical protein